MFETGRRSAISSSELGLYSDRADYNRNKYGPVVRKFVIGVMAVVAVILAAIFIYDFASVASTNSKLNQETKHIYILKNALKKPANFSKNFTTSVSQPKVDQLMSSDIQDRLDDSTNVSFVETNKTSHHEGRSLDLALPEMRSQTLANFKQRKRLLESDESDAASEEVEGKQMTSNHAVVYRVRQMYQHPDPEDAFEDESKPTPFHFELKGPQPSSFKRVKYPQLTQYRYPHTSRSIQDILKYLTNDPEMPKRGIKFTGVYVNPKKYDMYPELGGMVVNSDRSEMASGPDEIEEEEEEETTHFTISNSDPFFPYKPKHPADVNLLAPANVRFSPSGMHRFHPYYEPTFHRPLMMGTRPAIPLEQPYDTAAAYSGNFGKKKKAKPFSVMLDIYPITDINEQTTNKVSRPRPGFNDEYQDPRRPMSYGRGGRHFSGSHGATAPIPVVAVPAGQNSMSEEEKKQMIFHLNLYPRRKNKLNRNDILERSEAMRPEEQQEFAEKVMSPFAAITKQLTDHSAIEESKYQESDRPSTAPFTRYEESFLEMPNEEDSKDNDEKKSNHVPSNHKLEDLKDNKPTAEQEKKSEAVTITTPIDIDTPEGFQKFADGLVATD